jgi:hypothetical protein
MSAQKPAIARNFACDPGSVAGRGGGRRCRVSRGVIGRTGAGRALGWSRRWGLGASGCLGLDTDCGAGTIVDAVAEDQICNDSNGYDQTPDNKRHSGIVAAIITCHVIHLHSCIVAAIINSHVIHLQVRAGSCNFIASTHWEMKAFRRLINAVRHVQVRSQTYARSEIHLIHVMPGTHPGIQT